MLPLFGLKCDANRCSLQVYLVLTKVVFSFFSCWDVASDTVPLFWLPVNDGRHRLLTISVYVVQCWICVCCSGPLSTSSVSPLPSVESPVLPVDFSLPCTASTNDEGWFWQLCCQWLLFLVCCLSYYSLCAWLERICTTTVVRAFAAGVFITRFLTTGYSYYLENLGQTP